MGDPALRLILGVMDVDRLAIFVSAMGADIAALDIANSTALLVTTGCLDGLSIICYNITILALAVVGNEDFGRSEMETNSRSRSWNGNTPGSSWSDRGSSSCTTSRPLVNQFLSKLPEEGSRRLSRIGTGLVEEVSVYNTHGKQGHVDSHGPIFGPKLALNAELILSDAVVTVNH
jgi:hypothetical protein